MQAVRATPFIDYYFGLGQRISFTKKTAVILDYNTNQVKEYNLKIPFCPYIPFEIGLFSKKAVRWFLNNGFIPTEVADKNELTFIEVPSIETSPQYKQLERALQFFIKRLIKSIKNKDYSEWNHVAETNYLPGILEEALTHLFEFQKNLLNKKFNLAEICIRTAFDVTRRSTQFKKLYADFLLLINNPVAVKLYRELSSNAPINEAREYLEKALMIEPENSLLLTELEQLEYPEKVSVNFLLFAHSQLVKRAEAARASAFFDSIIKKDLKDPIALLVRLKTLEKGEAKRGILEKLVTLFTKIQDEDQKQYYQKKLNKYWKTAGRNTKIQLRPQNTLRKGTMSLGQSRSAILLTSLGARKNTIDSDVREMQSESPAALSSMPTQSYSASNSPKGTLRKSPLPNLSQHPQSKKEHVKEIDGFIKEKKFDSAKKAIQAGQAAIGLIGSFYKRTILLSDSDDFLLLEKLLWGYVEKNSWRKAELVATRLFEEYKKDDYRKEPAHKNKKCKFGIQLAECMYKQNRTNQSTALLYRLAREEHALKNKNNALSCLNKIAEFDPNYGSLKPIEKQIIYLLKYDCRAIEKRQADKVLESAFCQKIKSRATTKVPKHAHFGHYAAFCLDHPTYVACWMNLSMRILFTKTSAEVYEYEHAKPVAYPLKIDLTAQIPHDIALFTRKSIQWLLTTGFTPTIDTKRGICSFTATSKEDQENAPRALLLEKISRLKNTTSLTEVKESLTSFEECFNAENSVEAKACLKNACGSCGNKEVSKALGDIYAEYLSFCKNPEAISKYIELSVGVTKEISRYYLEKALITAIRTNSVDLAEEIYRKIQRAFLSNSEESSVWTNLHAFFYFKQCSPGSTADLFYSDARSIDQKSLLLPLARLCTIDTPAKDKRKEEYTRLAKLCINEPYVALYYQQKLAFEDETTSVKTVAAFVEKSCMSIFGDTVLHEEHRKRTLANFFTSHTFTNKLAALEKAVFKWKEISEKEYSRLEACLKKCYVLSNTLQCDQILIQLKNITAIKPPITLPERCVLEIQNLIKESTEFHKYFLEKLRSIHNALPKQIKDEEFPQLLLSGIGFFTREEYEEVNKILLKATDSRFNRMGEGYNNIIALYKEFKNFYAQRFKEYLSLIDTNIPKWPLKELSELLILCKNHVQLKNFAEAESCIREMRYLEGPENENLCPDSLYAFPVEVELCLDTLYTEYLDIRPCSTTEENIRAFFSPEFLYTTTAVNDNTAESITNYIKLTKSSRKVHESTPQILELQATESEIQRNRSQTTEWHRAAPKSANSPTLAKRKEEPADSGTLQKVKPLPVPVAKQNTLWPKSTNASLLYLERALELCIRLKDPRTIDIYHSILKLLNELEAPSHVRLLTHIHAFFYFKDLHPEHAELFFNNAVALAPEKHPLVAFAELAKCSKSDKSRRHKLFGEIVSFFVNPDNKSTYLLQRKFLDSYEWSSSSLEEYIYRQCCKSLEEERYVQAKNITCQYLDTLIEKEFWTPAQEVLNTILSLFKDITIKRCPGWNRYSEYFIERYEGERFALLKREILIQSNLKNGDLFESIQTLSSLYATLSKEEKCPQLSAFIYKSCAGHSANIQYAASLLSQNKIKEAANIYYENALLSVKGDYLTLLKYSIDNIKAIDPFYQFFTPDEQFILKLMESMLDATGSTIESGIEDLQIDYQRQSLDDAPTNRLSEQDTEALLDEAVTKLLSLDIDN